MSARMLVIMLVIMLLLTWIAEGCVVVAPSPSPQLTATPTIPPKQPEPSRPRIAGRFLGLPDNVVVTFYVRTPTGRRVVWGTRPDGGLWEAIVAVGEGEDSAALEVGQPFEAEGEPPGEMEPPSRLAPLEVPGERMARPRHRHVLAPPPLDGVPDLKEPGLDEGRRGLVAGGPLTQYVVGFTGEGEKSPILKHFWTDRNSCYLSCFTVSSGWVYQVYKQSRYH